MDVNTFKSRFTFSSSRKTAFLVVVLLLTAGCATKVPEYDERLSHEDAPASVTMAQIFIESLSYGELQKEIQTLNMLHEFSEGKSVYRAFELPEFIKPYVITVRSHVFLVDGKPRIFFPVVDLLDGDYKTTAQVSMTQSDAARAITRSGIIELEIPVKAGDEFFVIHTLPRLFDKNSVTGDLGSPAFSRAGTLDVVMPLRGEYSGSAE
jgi:hypothetical protein